MTFSTYTVRIASIVVADRDLNIVTHENLDRLLPVMSRKLMGETISLERNRENFPGKPKSLKNKVC